MSGLNFTLVYPKNVIYVLARLKEILIILQHILQVIFSYNTYIYFTKNSFTKNSFIKKILIKKK